METDIYGRLKRKGRWTMRVSRVMIGIEEETAVIWKLEDRASRKGGIKAVDGAG